MDEIEKDNDAVKQVVERLIRVDRVIVDDEEQGGLAVPNAVSGSAARIPS
jgi:hypothetical protein